MPRTRSIGEASVRNGSTTPITSVRFSERFWATELGRYSSVRIASSTRSRVAARDVPAVVDDAGDRGDPDARPRGDVGDPRCRFGNRFHAG